LAKSSGEKSSDNCSAGAGAAAAGEDADADFLAINASRLISDIKSPFRKKDTVLYT